MFVTEQYEYQAANVGAYPVNRGRAKSYSFGSAARKALKRQRKKGLLRYRSRLVV